MRTPAPLHGVKDTGQIKHAAIASEKYRGGDFEPSMGIQFSDVFYGWDAFQKVQVAGWLLIVAFGGVSVNTLFTFPDRRCITGGRTPPSPAGRASPAALGRDGISAFSTVAPFLELLRYVAIDGHQVPHRVLRLGRFPEGPARWLAPDRRFRRRLIVHPFTFSDRRSISRRKDALITSGKGEPGGFGPQRCQCLHHGHTVPRVVLANARRRVGQQPGHDRDLGDAPPGFEMWSVKRPVPSNSDQQIGRLCTHRLPGMLAVDVRLC